MFESLLTIAIYLTAIFTPLLIPATVHVVRDGRLTFRPRLAAWLPRQFPRPVVGRRAAAPAAA